MRTYLIGFLLASCLCTYAQTPATKGKAKLQPPQVKALPKKPCIEKGPKLTMLTKLEGANAPKSVEISPDGSYAAVMNLEGCNIWIVDAVTYKKIQVVNFDKTKATGWDYNTNKPIPSFAEKPVECDFTDNGKNLWVSFHNGASVVKYNYLDNLTPITGTTDIQKATVTQNGKTYRVEMPKIGVGETPKVIKATPDGTKIVVSNWHSSNVSIIQTYNNTKTTDVYLGKDSSYIPRGIAITADSKLAYICNMHGGTISVLNLETLKEEGELKITPNPRHIVLSKDNKHLYISDNDAGKVVDYNLDSNKVVRSVFLGNQARTIALTPDEKYMFVCMHYSNKVSIVDMQTFTEVGCEPVYRPMGVAVAPNGNDVWVSSYQGGWVAVYRFDKE